MAQCCRVSRSTFSTILTLLVVASLSACAAGPHFTPEHQAGFIAGVWHGLISLITLIISVFSDQVAVYELDNTGWGYDFGFWLGIVIMAGGGSSGAHVRQRRRRHDAEWDEIGRKLEAKMRRLIREWSEAEPDDDWKVVGDKAEAKLKRELRRWADEP